MGGIHDGHRERLRKKLLRLEHDEILPHELLEVMLFYSIPRGDTNEIAHELINAFGSFNRVLDADWVELKKVRGIGEKTAQYIDFLGKCARCYTDHIEPGIKYKFGNKRTMAYIYTTFPDMNREQIYMLYLDGRKTIVRRELVFEGSFESVDVDMGTIAKRALRHGMVYCVCLHNHPSGIAKGSYADKEVTYVMQETMELLGMTLLDSIVATENEQYSILYDKSVAFNKKNDCNK